MHFRHRSILAGLLTGALIFVGHVGAADDKPGYTDEQLETMTPPGPNPFLSFLPAEAEVDWEYWHAKAAYESRLRAGRALPSTRLLSVNEVEPNDTLATAQVIAGFGTGAGDDPEADIAGSATGGDIDCYSVALETGDILGVAAANPASRVEVFEPGGELQMGSAQDASFIYPAASPMPGGGRVANFVSYTSDNHFVCVRGTGSYTARLRVFRPVLEGTSDTHILFVDFDGATINPSIFGGPNEDRTLSPLSNFLAGWGLTPADEDAVIDAVMASISETIEDDLGNGENPAFSVELRNSRDHADPFGQPNVSRLIVGGTIAELGVSTIGIAQTIDPGNFETEESAVTLLDLLSAGAGNPNSLNQFALGGGATRLDVVGIGVGNITAHEAGHYLGNWHTEQFAASSDPSIMDQGGNLAGTVGIGPDNIFGTADDFDVDFTPDAFVGSEGFTGTEHTNENTRYGLTGGGGGPSGIFADGFESGDTSQWSSAIP